MARALGVVRLAARCSEWLPVAAGTTLALRRALAAPVLSAT